MSMNMLPGKMENMFLPGKRLEDILTTLSRWYDFHVFFQNPEVKEVVFSGELRRFDSFSDILRLIEKTSDVKFTTTGNTVLVRE